MTKRFATHNKVFCIVLTSWQIRLKLRRTKDYKRIEFKRFQQQVVKLLPAGIVFAGISYICCHVSTESCFLALAAEIG
jgi:hypothetical protein